MEAFSASLRTNFAPEYRVGWCHFPRGALVMMTARLARTGLTLDSFNSSIKA